MIGSTSPRMLDLCARHADLWNGWGKNDPAAIPPVREVVDAACRRSAASRHRWRGRSPSWSTCRVRPAGRGSSRRS
jgi:alkanesulfonate monooxygenase SsuD/methylene tetrahydromethanopterin reductase-like flavin-dependent oxidoreductase (luciferase family)